MRVCERERHMTIFTDGFIVHTVVASVRVEAASNLTYELIGAFIDICN